MSRRALLLLNSHSRQGKEHAHRVAGLLRGLGLELLEVSPAQSQSLSDVIRDHKDEVDLVIVGGGDGSLNSGTDGLVEARLPVGILPLGTANDLARTLGIPTDLEQACRVIVEGHTKRVDLGWVNGKYFFNVASVGLTVQITQQLSKAAKRRWGVLAYLLTAARVVWHARPFHAEIRCDGRTCQVKTVQIAVGNGRHYGGGLTVAEDAAIDDGCLDLYSLEIDHWWQILPLLPALWRGTLAGCPRARTLRGASLKSSCGGRGD